MMTQPKVKTTKEGKLTDLFDKHCHKKDIPFFAGVNGPRIEGWSHIPDRVMGEPKDDLLTKCIVIEIKPTKEGAVNDLRSKEEYKTVKFLAAIYFENGKPCGSLHSWRDAKGSLSFVETIPTRPLNEFLKTLHDRYKAAVNPKVTTVVNTAISLKPLYKPKEIFSVMSGSFTNQKNPGSLPWSLNNFWSLCDEINRPEDKTQVLHDVIFAPDTHKERHKWGQFITEYPHSLKIAEKVVEIFDEHQDLTIYEPCVGTGAIACELLTLLFRKYGKRKSKKIMTEQLKFADIGPRMRAYAKVALYIHTKKLFGEGITFNIEKNDLETDSFDLSKMIVYGNYPFNKGTDYNYLAKILRQQMKCGLSLGVFMGDSATFDSRKIQSRNILGDDFYTWIKEEYTTNDFKDVNVKISMMSFDKSRKKLQNISSMEKFIPLKDLDVKIGQLSNFPKGARFKDGTSLHSTKYNKDNSISFFRIQELLKCVPFRMVPSPNAPTGTLENEVYLQWIQEQPKYSIPKPFTGLICSRYTTGNGEVRQRYFEELITLAGTGMTTTFEGDTKYIGIIGLVVSSQHFKNVLINLFPRWQQKQRALSMNILKKFPIPKNIPDRLYEIGEELIIQGKTDQALRDEADGIIEELYKELKICL